MNKKIIIGGVIAVVAIIVIAAVALGGGSSEHAPDELVACVAAHREEPEFGFAQCMVGAIMILELNLLYKVHFLKEMQIIVLLMI